MFQHPHKIRIADYDYSLPDERIAKFPLEQRDASKLLLYKNGKISTRQFFELPDMLPADSLLVFNNTKVIQARLIFSKDTGAQIEVFCLEPYSPNDYAQAFQQTQCCEWKCMVGNLKKWKTGVLKLFVGGNDVLPQRITAEKISTVENTHIIRFTWDNPVYNFADILELAGELPIPPYLHRSTIEKDKETYQTVYSKIKGSVAAPTAGLHFTPQVLANLQAKGIETNELTLHVGAGTFQPVKSDVIEGHTMHAELISVRKETIARLLTKIDTIVAVGTTSVRTLESLYYVGVLLEKNPNATQAELAIMQWMPYQTEFTITTTKALQNILTYLESKQLDRLQTSTQIIIAPGYQFNLVKAIITNFHQPKSTLLLLISAFLAGDWKGVYTYALENDYRFLSYGDSSLLINDVLESRIKNQEPRI